MSVSRVPAISRAFRSILRNSVTQLLPSGYQLDGTGKTIQVCVGLIGGKSTRSEDGLSHRSPQLLHQGRPFLYVADGSGA